MSETVAEAADTASVALTAEPCAALGVSFAPPLGNNTRTTPNQNATRNKKIMVLPFCMPSLSLVPEATAFVFPRAHSISHPSKRRSLDPDTFAFNRGKYDLILWQIRNLRIWLKLERCMHAR